MSTNEFMCQINNNNKTHPKKIFLSSPCQDFYESTVFLKINF